VLQACCQASGQRGAQALGRANVHTQHADVMSVKHSKKGAEALSTVALLLTWTPRLPGDIPVMLLHILSRTAYPV